MRVLQVIDRLEAGGAERVYLDLTQLLLDKSIEVDTLTISGKGVLYESLDTRAKHFFLDRKNKFSYKKMFECANYCANYDIVHVHMRHTYTYVRLSQIVSRKKYKIIFHDHYGDIENDKQVPIGLRLIFKPSYYIGVSHSLSNWAKMNLDIDPNFIWMLRNTIIPYANNNDVVKNNKWVIVSNIRSSKNIEFAIEFAKNNNQYLDIYGQVSDNEYAKKITTLVKENEKIKLISNELNVQSILSNYQLAIHVAHSESGPLVLMEYLIQGLPFLAHNTGEVADVLMHEIPECFVSNLNKDDWQKKIKVLNNNLPNEEKLKGLFYQYFGPEQYINQCLAIYQKVINS